jgi:putative redox protein
MRVTARRRQGFLHDVEIEGGHAIVVDEPAQAGGTDSGPRPTLLLASSLASCTAITMEMYAERKGWDIGEVEVDVDVAYDGATPASFEVSLRLPEGLSEEQRDRLRTIAGKCPVHKVVAAATPVTIAERTEPL